MTGPPSKVAFFVSTVTLRRILTINNLIRRCHILVNWCCTCCRDVESVDHSPIHCPIASRLRFLIVRLFGLGWVGLGLGSGSIGYDSRGSHELEGGESWKTTAERVDDSISVFDVADLVGAQ